MSCLFVHELMGLIACVLSWSPYGFRGPWQTAWSHARGLAFPRGLEELRE